MSNFAEIWLCLLAAGLSGVAAGWLVWSRPNERVKAVYRARLAKFRGNWETADEQLDRALARISELERAMVDRETRPQGSPRTDSSAEPAETRDSFRIEHQLLEATVRGLDERLRSLEAGLSPHTAGIDVDGGGSAASFSHSGLPGETSQSLRRRVAKRKESAQVK
jgi:hypothetical protein